MSKGYGTIAFTEAVREVQNRYGSGAFYQRKTKREAPSGQTDPLGEKETDFLSRRDSFYLATVSETGWPYVQIRGGPTGFLRIIDSHTIGWADFQGNLQYISTGNLARDDRAALIAVDYPARRRLKLFGHAHVVPVEDDPRLAEVLAVPGYRGHVERSVIISIEAFDWNCPQHITQRFTAAEIEPLLAPLRREVAALQAENAALRRAQTATAASSIQTEPN